MAHGDDDTFLRESREEVEAARRLLDRRCVTTTTASAARKDDAVRANLPASTAVAQGADSTVVKQPAAGIIRGLGGEASTEKRVTMSQPTLGALSDCGDGSETEDASSNNSRFTPLWPSDRSARGASSGRAGADQDFYRAALSTHLSFITTTAADDPPPSLGSPDGRTIEGGGRKPAGGVGEACRVLRGDVAGVRQVRQIARTHAWGWR